MAIAIMDLVTALLFVVAAGMAVATRIALRRRNPLWAGTSAVFLLYAIKYAMNSQEWAAPERFAYLDRVDDYFSMAAAAILAGLCLYFWWIARQVSAQQRAEGQG